MVTMITIGLGLPSYQIWSF